MILLSSQFVYNFYKSFHSQKIVNGSHLTVFLFDPIYVNTRTILSYFVLYTNRNVTPENINFLFPNISQFHSTSPAREFINISVPLDQSYNTRGFNEYFPE